MCVCGSVVLCTCVNGGGLLCAWMCARRCVGVWLCVCVTAWRVVLCPGALGCVLLREWARAVVCGCAWLRAEEGECV